MFQFCSPLSHCTSMCEYIYADVYFWLNRRMMTRRCCCLVVVVAVIIQSGESELSCSMYFLFVNTNTLTLTHTHTPLKTEQKSTLGIKEKHTNIYTYNIKCHLFECELGFVSVCVYRCTHVKSVLNSIRFPSLSLSLSFI